MHKITKIISFSAIFIILAGVFCSCEKDPQMPKPSTYLRLDIPKSSYISLQQSDFPFSFEIPKDGKVQIMQSHSKDMSWFNISFEDLNFDINVSYLKLTSDTMLRYAVNDCYTFLSRHEKLSGGIVQQDYSNAEKRLYGTLFDINGRDVVSPFQFYLTDSTSYFVRFALNNRQMPNNDSITPIVQRLKDDMMHIIETFSWNETH